MALKTLILRAVAKQRGELRWVPVRSRRSAGVVEIETAAGEAAERSGRHPHVVG